MERCYFCGKEAKYIFKYEMWDVEASIIQKGYNAKKTSLCEEHGEPFQVKYGKTYFEEKVQRK